jgi:lipid-A-disaccharide synthase
LIGFFVYTNFTNNSMQKIFIISGEASGDLHASNLVKELKNKLPHLQLQGWGGGLMEKEGVDIKKHYKELAFMGFVEVLKNIRTIFKNFELCRNTITAFKPDAIIFVDYPGFNLRMVKWAKQQGYKTIYYISPQIWAWKENRIHDIKKYIDKMIVILPFEEAFYKRWNYAVDYVGHPLVKVIDDFKATAAKQMPTKEKIIAILPGSRKQEIKKKLPIMLAVAKALPDYKFIVAKAPGVEDDLYEDFLKEYTNVGTVTNDTYHLLYRATAAIVTSGTATLETALFNVPQVVCYKGSKISYLIAKQIIKIKYISLVNLIMDKLIVEELIQDHMNAKNIEASLIKILEKNNREAIITQYNELYTKLSVGGNASLQAAQIIVDSL